MTTNTANLAICNIYGLPLLKSKDFDRVPQFCKFFLPAVELYNIIYKEHQCNSGQTSNYCTKCTCSFLK